ncbi:unnamed protein product [Acanthoscelides obtectus]|nr:unnamed protein product [Acanthoscelides obtectus]CAK1678375.1 hypothetical protein AOBTE_LOCUS31849 [Acanthoscelides obtectus]
MVPEGATVISSGWGVTEMHSDIASDILRDVDLKIINNEICLRKVKEAVTKRMICATGGRTGKDTCEFDSGGPLEYNGTLVGIVSWGRGCGIKNMPGVYTSVARLRPWIDTHAVTQAIISALD